MGNGEADETEGFQFFLNLLLINSMIPGKMDKKIMAKITNVKLLFTKGISPKKYPNNRKETTHANPPSRLNTINLP